MDVAPPESHSETQSETSPLLMDHPVSINSGDHVIDIAGNNVALSSSSAQSRPSNGLNTSQQDRSSSNNVRLATSSPLPPIIATNVSSASRNSSSLRRGETRRRRSPLNSGLWISIELALTVGQIVASIVVLSFSRHEHPRTPLFAWILGYASGCVATLPLLFWRYRHHNQLSDQELAQPRPGAQLNRFSLQVSRTSERDDQRPSVPDLGNRFGSDIMNARFKAFVEYFKMALDCFFAIWFVVGNVWIFGGHSSAGEAPNLYRLCIVFLTFSCIGYAMPFILCATICCCLPCIMSALGFREDLTQNRGATSESIDALPVYKFKVKKNRHGDNRDGSEGGVIAAGTDKERAISGEDAVCCICLAKYANNEELRELPCAHFFHKECVDKWLKINASCPLCKNDVAETPSNGDH